MTTLVVGVSPDSDQFANKAVRRLQEYGHEVVALGARPGKSDGVPVLVGKPHLANIHTITLYLNAERQKTIMDYLLSLNPKRIIFNPGAENPDLVARARRHGVETVQNCTLVMLASKRY